VRLLGRETATEPIADRAEGCRPDEELIRETNNGVCSAKRAGMGREPSAERTAEVGPGVGTARRRGNLQASLERKSVGRCLVERSPITAKATVTRPSERPVADSTPRGSRPLWLRIVGGIVALTLLVALGIQLSSSWSQLQTQLLDVSLIGAILALALMTSGETLVGVAWGLGMRAIGSKPSLVGSTAVHFVSSLGRAAPGMVATVAGRIALANRAQASRKVAGAGTLMELVLSASGALVVGVPAIFVVDDLTVIRGVSPVGVAASLAVLAAGGFVAIRWLVPALSTRWDADMRLPDVSATVGLVAIYALIWATYGLAIVVLSASAGITMPAFWITGGLFALSWLIGFIVFFVPGGLGIREGVLVLLLSPVVPNDQAIVVALLARVLWWLTTFLIAGIGAVWLWATSQSRGRPATDR